MRPVRRFSCSTGLVCEPANVSIFPVYRFPIKPRAAALTLARISKGRRPRVVTGVDLGCYATSIPTASPVPASGTAASKGGRRVGHAIHRGPVLLRPLVFPVHSLQRDLSLSHYSSHFNRFRPRLSAPLLTTEFFATSNIF